jgi:DNA-binding Lrp family transcriptional regulator
MDKKDIQILRTIAEEGINSPEKIEQHTEIPKSTVHYRMNQLREDGIIENDLGDMNLSKLGLSITLISEIYAEFGEGYHDTVGKQLAEVEGVNQVYFTMGDTDFIVVAHVTDREMVESLVADYEAIEGIERTSSRFVITRVKDEPYPISDFEYETLVDAIDDE